MNSNEKIIKKPDKKLITAAVIAATVIIIAVVIAVFVIRASNRDYKGTDYISNYISPSDIAASDGYAYIADGGTGKLYKASLSGMNAEKSWDAGSPVNGVCVNGNDIYALSGGADGKITKLDSNLKVIASADTGHTPVAAVVVDEKIYVANRFSSTVTVYNVSDLSQTGEPVEVGREPFSMAAANGNIYVAGRLIDGASDGTVNSTDIIVINTGNDTVAKIIPLLNGTSSVNDICASPDGKYIYASSTIGRYSYPFTQIDRAWIISNGINIIDVSSQSLYTAVLLDEVELGAANPWGLECADDGTLVVSIAATNEAVIIDTDKMFKLISQVNRGTGLVKTMEDIPNYIPFLDSARKRIKLDGIGARSLTISGGMAYICQYFTGNVAVLDIENGTQLTGNTISLGEHIPAGGYPENDKIREGEILWNDATLTYQQWLSCASCHPDARTDGFNWAGVAKPHTNTKSMLYSERTPPVLTRATRINTYSNIVNSFHFDNYTILTDEQYDAVDQYLKSLVPVQSPYRNRDGSLTESAERGEKLFESQGCAACHPAPLYTDMNMYLSKVRADNWEKDLDIKYDVPSLVEIWRSGPWMNDGSKATLREAVEAFLPSGHNLTDSQIDDLTNFVGSIGNEGEIYGVDMVTFTDTSGAESYVKLKPGSVLSEITVMKQYKTDEDATILINLFDSDGKSIEWYAADLDPLNVREITSVQPGIKVPGDLAEGSFYIISITGKGGEKLASDYKIIYQEGEQK